MTQQLYVWDITLPADTNTKDSIIETFEKWCKKWVFQRETGATGYDHYQARVSLKSKGRLGDVIRIGMPGAHWSPTSDENKANTFYVMKEDTRTEGPWSNETAESKIYVPIRVRDALLKPWQQAVINSVTTRDDRTINVIIDETGNSGKSFLKTYVLAHGLGRPVPPMDNGKDLMRMIMDTPKKQLYIIDIPRAIAHGKLRELYSGIETIKDGYAYDDRYSFKECLFEPPQMWIFTNTEPKYEWLSEDRWKIWQIIDNKLEPRPRGI